MQLSWVVFVVGSFLLVTFTPGDALNRRNAGVQSINQRNRRSPLVPGLPVVSFVEPTQPPTPVPVVQPLITPGSTNDTTPTPPPFQVKMIPPSVEPVPPVPSTPPVLPPVEQPVVTPVGPPVVTPVVIDMPPVPSGPITFGRKRRGLSSPAAVPQR